VTNASNETIEKALILCVKLAPVTDDDLCVEHLQPQDASSEWKLLEEHVVLSLPFSGSGRQVQALADQLLSQLWNERQCLLHRRYSLHEALDVDNVTLTSLEAVAHLVPRTSGLRVLNDVGSSKAGSCVFAAISFATGQHPNVAEVGGEVERRCHLALTATINQASLEALNLALWNKVEINLVCVLTIASLSLKLEDGASIT